MGVNIHKVVNIIEKEQQPLAEFSIAKCALFTHDTSVLPISEGFREFISLSEVNRYYDINSDTVRMATAFFQASNSAIDNKGSLTIIPTGNISGKRASILTVDLSSKVNAFKLISDGSLIIDTIEISKLNFTKINNVKDIFDIILKGIEKEKILIDAEFIQATNKINFISKNVGADSSISITAGTVGTDITSLNYLNIANATLTAGSNAIFNESLINAIQRTYQIGYTGIMTTLELDINQVINIETTLKDLYNTSLSKNFMIFVYNVPNINDASVVEAFYNADSKRTNIILLSALGSKEDGQKLCASFLSESVSRGFVNAPLRTLSNKKLNINISSNRFIHDDNVNILRNAGIHPYLFMNQSNSFQMFNSPVPAYTPEQLFFIADFNLTAQKDMNNIFSLNTITNDNKNIVRDEMIRLLSLAKDGLYISSPDAFDGDLTMFSNTITAKEKILLQGFYVELGNVDVNKNLPVKYIMFLSGVAYTATINFTISK